MKDILHKTADGKPLGKLDYKRLLTYIGIKRSITLILMIIFITLIAVCIIIIQVLSEGLRYIPITVVGYLVLLLLIHYSPKDHFHNFQLYLKALDEFYDKKFASYYGYYIFRTVNLVDPIKNNKNPSILFLSNGYEFILYEDLLKNTSVELRDIASNVYEYHFLRVIDKRTIDNEPFIFKPEDIASYFEVIKSRSQVKADYNYKNHTLQFPLIEYKNYVEILLLDNSVLRLGMNVLEILRMHIPTKEIKRPR